MDECGGLVYAVRKGSQADGPGVRTVVLFKGCSFSCWWCSEPGLQSFAEELAVGEKRCVRCGSCVATCTTGAAHEEQLADGSTRVSIDRGICIVCGRCIDHCAGEGRAIVGRHMSVTEVLDQIAPQEGVTFGGGEPLMQIEFLSGLLKASKALGIHTAVDTSGYAPWEVLERIRADVDLFLYNLKIMDEARHREFSGLSNAPILENLRRLAECGQRILLRMPLIPGVNDDVANLAALASFAASLPNIDGVEMLPYLQTGPEKYELFGRPYPDQIARQPVAAQTAAALDIFLTHGLTARVV